MLGRAHVQRTEEPTGASSNERSNRWFKRRKEESELDLKSHLEDTADERKVDKLLEDILNDEWLALRSRSALEQRMQELVVLGPAVIP